MAVTQAVSFETGAASSDAVAGVVSGTTSYSTSTVRTGGRSLRTNPASGASGRYQFSTASGTYWHVALRVETMPSVTRAITGSLNGGDINLRLNADGTISYYNGSTLQGTSTTALVTGRWYWIAWRQQGGLSSVVLLQIDGTTEITGSTGTNPAAGLGPPGTEASAIDLFWDDFIVDDAGFLAPSRVAMLVPISDNARDAKWTGGVGGTTNLFDAVDNTPPTGTATETDTTQIEHAGGAAGTTDKYDANMTSYLTAGISGNDTILGIDYFICHGEDVGAGTKLLNFSLVSNPTQASGIGDFAAGNDAGALGTFPTNWTTTHNTFISTPTVTLNTSPVMRVVRPETATRVASVCLMAMNVAFTPKPIAKLLQVDQAIHRSASF